MSIWKWCLTSKGIGLTSKVSRSYCLPLGAHLHRWSVCRVFWGDKVRLSSGIATNNVAIQYYLHPFSGVFRGELQWQRGFACFEAISLHCNCFEQTNCITLIAIHISPKQFRVFPPNTAYGFSPYTLQPGDCGKCSTSVQYFILYITLYYTI